MRKSLLSNFVENALYQKSYPQLSTWLFTFVNFDAIQYEIWKLDFTKVESVNSNLAHIIRSKWAQAYSSPFLFCFFTTQRLIIEYRGT